MTRCEVGDECCPAQRHFLSVVQDAVDLDLTGTPIHTLPRFDVLLHDHDLGSDALPEKHIGRLVIPVGVAAQDDLDVGQVEAELRHASFDHGDRSLEIRVDEDVPLRRRNQERAQASGAHEVEVVHHLMCRERIIPSVLRQSVNGGGRKDGQHQDEFPHVVSFGRLWKIRCTLSAALVRCHKLRSPRRSDRRGLSNQPSQDPRSGWLEPPT